MFGRKKATGTVTWCDGCSLVCTAACRAAARRDRARTQALSWGAGFR